MGIRSRLVGGLASLVLAGAVAGYVSASDADIARIEAKKATAEAELAQLQARPTAESTPTDIEKQNMEDLNTVFVDLWKRRGSYTKEMAVEIAKDLGVLCQNAGRMSRTEVRTGIIAAYSKISLSPPNFPICPTKDGVVRTLSEIKMNHLADRRVGIQEAASYLSQIEKTCLGINDITADAIAGWRKTYAK